MILNFIIKSSVVTTDPTCWWISKKSAWFTWFTSFYGMKDILIPNIFSSFSFFDRGRLPSTNIHNWIWWSHRVGSTRASVKNVSHKRAPDLAWFTLYSLFCPLCFVSFFKFCLHLSHSGQSSGALFCFVLRILLRKYKVHKGHLTTTWTDFCHLLTPHPPTWTVFITWAWTKADIFWSPPPLILST